MNMQFINAFYDTDLGRYVAEIISSKIERHTHRADQTIVASVGAYAFMQSTVHDGRIIHQSYQTQSQYPAAIAGNVVEMDTYQWPYRAESVDVVVLAHDLEFVDERLAYLREAWRVLKGEGTLIIVVPNRKGQWVKSGQTPFGYGHACHMGSLLDVFQRSHFRIDTVHPVLFYPPKVPCNKFQCAVRRLYDSCGEYLGLTPGVRILEVSKHIYAPTRGLKEMMVTPADMIMRSAKTTMTKSREKL